MQSFSWRLHRKIFCNWQKIGSNALSRENAIDSTHFNSADSIKIICIILSVYDISNLYAYSFTRESTMLERQTFMILHSMSLIQIPICQKQFSHI